MKKLTYILSTQENVNNMYKTMCESLPVISCDERFKSIVFYNKFNVKVNFEFIKGKMSKILGRDFDEVLLSMDINAEERIRIESYVIARCNKLNYL